MTGSEILETFHTIVDDEIDETQELIILNMAKNQIEGGRDWNFMRAFDNSSSATPSDDYLTAHTLPTRFLAPRKLYLNGELSPYMLIPFEERDRYKDIYKRYYIDWINQQFFLCGKVGQTTAINFFYQRYTPDVTLVTSPVWPSIFHALIPFKMAEIYMSGMDSDDINRSMAPANRLIQKELLNQMILWDAKMKTMEYNDPKGGNVDFSSYPNIVDYP